MKAILKFNLPEDQNEHELAINAEKYYSVLWDLDQFLRNKIKYSPDSVEQIEIDSYQTIRDELWNLLNSHNLDLDK